MLFGVEITPLMLEGIGIILGIGLLFQVLAGQRVINLPRKYHLKVHRWTGWTLLAVAALHGLMAFAYLMTFGRLIR
jgi:hypothetical protein